MPQVCIMYIRNVDKAFVEIAVIAPIGYALSSSEKPTEDIYQSLNVRKPIGNGRGSGLGDAIIDSQRRMQPLPVQRDDKGLYLCLI